MTKMTLVLTIFCVVVLVVFGCKRGRWQDALADKTTEELAFQYKIVRDESTQIPLFPSRKITILLSKESYSQESLDQLFRWASRKYKLPEQQLMVDVYTNENLIPVGLGGSSGFQAGQGGICAIFWSQEKDYSLNEWYKYSLDANYPRFERTVVIKGRPSTSNQLHLKSFDVASGPFLIRVESYELKDVAPAGIYSTFYTLTKGVGKTAELLTLNQSFTSEGLANNFKAVNDKVAYIFAGSFYLVTVDGGRTWGTWDGERELPGYQCCIKPVIQSVQIFEDGSGTMSLLLNPEQQKGEINLRTANFGQSWFKGAL